MILKNRNKIQSLRFGGLVGDNQLPKSVQSFLKNNGEEVITSVQVCRIPLSPILNKFGIAFLKSNNKKLNYDKLYHLYILINGKYRLEKNEIIQFTSGGKMAGSECRDAGNPSNTTIQEFFDKTAKRMGKDFTPYDAVRNNCQNFVMACLNANNISNSGLKDFVLQNVGSIAEDQPLGTRAIRTLTDISALGKYLLGYRKGGVI